MKSMRTQFHADRNELFDFAKMVIAKFSLHFVLVKHRPFAVFYEDEFEDILASDSLKNDINSILFTYKKIQRKKNNDHFIDKVNNYIELEIGKQSKDSLLESFFGFMSEDLKLIEIGNKVGRELKKITVAGVIGVKPKSGATAFYSEHRYTQTAKELELKGVKILPFAGIAIIKLNFNKEK
ncbi:hypothetical protein EHQ52_13090 [Leptospira koniambonensis]|uniref:Uncharacterized protein n=1 Tax=Leptospira koniambonensis TaxID=2484950 RepID=A0A4R9J971_9LEPT|nr:hypothetical protein [Leptospira koniambonensis]TGL35393.1 hypothetical protein EHQ52_13090 [Leptospira koniambonensis]